MISSVVTILLLAALVGFTTINSFRMWRGKSGFALRPLSPSYRKTSQCQRFLTVNSISTFGWWSFALMGAAGYGLGQESSTAFRVMLYVPLLAGLMLFVATLVFGISIFIVGRPLRFIPPQFRDAAAKKWDDGP